MDEFVRAFVDALGESFADVYAVLDEVGECVLDFIVAEIIDGFERGLSAVVRFIL